MENTDLHNNTSSSIGNKNIFYLFLPLILMCVLTLFFALGLYPLIYDDCSFYCELELRGISDVISFIIILPPSIFLSIFGVHRVNKFIKTNGRGFWSTSLLVIYFCYFLLNFGFFVFLGKLLYMY